jgi:hypothetical protein
MFDVSLMVIGATLLVAYANGANDNFKGVATLFGSEAADYRTALGWATVTTLAGSLAAVFLAGKLISIFQGRFGARPALRVGAIRGRSGFGCGFNGHACNQDRHADFNNPQPDRRAFGQRPGRGWF